MPDAALLMPVTTSPRSLLVISQGTATLPPLVLNHLGRAGRWYDGVPELALAFESLTLAPVDHQQRVLNALAGWLAQVQAMGSGIKVSGATKRSPPPAPPPAIVTKRHERRRFDQLVAWYDQLACLQGLSSWHHRQAARLLQFELGR